MSSSPATPAMSVLGRDPSHRRCVLNGQAFQQDAIRTFRGWQYACFYASLPASVGEPTGDALFVHVARRALPRGEWEILVLDDYEQTTDDGHNTVQLGICPGDGTIHLAFDHHCDGLHYRLSHRAVALQPGTHVWGTHLFGPTRSHLPGLEGNEAVDALLGDMTYPRFGPLGATGDLWLTFRTGRAGLGDDHLCIYRHRGARYELVGTPLEGDACNAYLHGLDCVPSCDSDGDGAGDSGRGSVLYATWVYRDFVPYPGWDDEQDRQHKQQAGPNTAANNHDICFAYSADEGRTWRNGAGHVVATLARDAGGGGGGGAGNAIRPTSPGIVAFAIPKGSGLTNQEAQAVGHNGSVHVLNRDSLGGELVWKHYYRSPSGTWTQRALRFAAGFTGDERGRLVLDRDDDLYFVLPDAKSSALSIWQATKRSRYSEYRLRWRQEGFPPGEPLVDTARIDHDNVLSVFTRATAETHEKGTDELINVVVLDFQL